MPKNVTIDLADPIEGHEGKIRKLVLRPPVLRDILKYGEPYTIHRSSDGQYFFVDDNEALAHYAEVCLVEPAEFSLAQAQVGVADSLKLRQSIKDFFLRAGEARED